ncbi:MAG: 4Fe-4S dicluster domain-containing protein [Bdellovibrionales bacterium]|nr:4Fe-4S dicluster domain-containing protein [Bdellovibrionales bacterium]
MSLSVREGQFDLAVVAGPRVPVWPSVGVRTLTALASEMGLTVGVFGFPGHRVTGVLPLPGSGGLVLAEDPQGRIHRISARAVVRLAAPNPFPAPFPGWRTEGLVPLRTAKLLFEQSRVRWTPATVILGTGNGALRFGSRLIETEASPMVACVELGGPWGGKSFAGWEVERRRFETLGGRVLNGKLLRLDRKGPGLWELRLQDARGVRILEVGRVVAAGPFHDQPGVREYPPGSCLYEMEQTGPAARPDDVEGWVLEEERGRWLGARIARSLVADLGERKEALEKTLRRARARLKACAEHQGLPFAPAYDGKWLSRDALERLRSFEGVPRQAQKARVVASLECVESIPCNLCEKVCPESAIQIRRGVEGESPTFLIESDCTACGLCLAACPSGAAVMLHERDQSTSLLTLPWSGAGDWEAGDLATLVNRKGERLGSARVSTQQALPEGAPSGPGPKPLRLVQIEVPTHLVWQARGLRAPRSPGVDAEVGEASLRPDAAEPARAEILLDGEKRLVREGLTVSIALFELGRARGGDALLCPDGSCGLCDVTIDGVKQRACQVKVRRGMAIRLAARSEPAPDALCPCLGVSEERALERMKQGKLSSCEAAVAVTHVGDGRCHGQLCGAAFRKLMADAGIDSAEWSDWRFPWTDWQLPPRPGG